MVWLAVLAGMCFSLMGVAYRVGMPRGVFPLHILGIVSVAGAAVFGVRALGGPAGGVPVAVLVLGLGTGATQYLMIPLLRAGLRAGPLSPLWCVLMLSFVPVSFYAFLRFGEDLTWLHYAGIGAACLCVVMATLGEGGGTDPAEAPKVGRSHRLRYAAILVALLALNSTNGVSLKELDFLKDAGGLSLKDRFGDLYLALLYAGIVGGAAADQLVTKRPPPPWRWALLLGGLATFGSVVGTYCLLQAATGAAAIVFPTNSVASIVFTSILATAFLGEKRTWSWYACLGFGILAVALANGQALVACLGRGS